MLVLTGTLICEPAGDAAVRLLLTGSTGHKAQQTAIALADLTCSSRPRRRGMP